ncbi:MAG: M48 family metallopeptidase [Burkholderiaceae bacterium]
MTATGFALLFLFALTCSTVLRLWLGMRQVRHVRQHRGAVPQAFAEGISLSAHQRAADYTVARVGLGLVDALANVFLLIALTLLGGLQWIYDQFDLCCSGSPLLAQLGFVATVAVLGSLLDLPLAWYRQFRLEKRFGFNRMSPALFIADIARGTLLAALIGLPMIALVLWLMQQSGSAWWFWVWLAWMSFNLVLLVLYPTVIAPRFNTFEPLPDNALRDRVESLLRRCGFTVSGLYVMDGSRRSSHGNAYFTGFGKAKRIVFFDTLLQRLDADQIEAVLAHELGHFRHRHILKRIALSFVGSFLGLALLGWLAQQPWFYAGLGMTPGLIGYEGPALVLFMLALPAFVFPMRPLAAWMSRRDEFEADAYAAGQTEARHLASALVRLYKDNATTLTPDPVHSAFYDSHPPASVRVGRLLGLGAAPPGNAPTAGAHA